MMQPEGDRPRKIVVCHPDDFVRVNEAVMALGHGDVLVQRNKYVEAGNAYVMNDPFGPIKFTEFNATVQP